MSHFNGLSAVAELQDPSTIRARCANVLKAGLSEQLEHFRIDLGCLSSVVDRVERITLASYPKLNIPRHSRFNHFRAGGVERLESIAADLPSERVAHARSLMGLVVVSVLLDAGAGAQWRYQTAGDPTEYSRSEGLAVASFDAFASGLFSATASSPLQVDGVVLEKLEVDELKRVFQVSDANPMRGLEGRCRLLQKLGVRAQQATKYFGDSGRVGGLVDGIMAQAVDGEFSARQLLPFLLEALRPIWPERNQIDGVELGDVWRHPHAGGKGVTKGWLPLHKLSQWLCYSVLEVLTIAGLKVVDEEALTGLAEYRNGGLLLDSGVLVLRKPSKASCSHSPGSGLIIEWRALTVALLEKVSVMMIERFAARGQDMTLGMVLEGGTWQAGRQIAGELRAGATSPLIVQSDGTLF